MNVRDALSEELGRLAMRGGYGLGVLASERLADDLAPFVQGLIAGAAVERVELARVLSPFLERCNACDTDGYRCVKPAGHVNAHDSGDDRPRWVG